MEINSLIIIEDEPDEKTPSAERAEIRHNYKKKLDYFDWRDDLMSKHILEFDPRINV